MSYICLFNIWHLTVTLTLSWHMGNIGSAHPLVEMNVSFKLEGNPSISKGVIEQTRHNVYYLFVKYLTFNCDPDLELTHGLHELCTSPSWSKCVI